MVLWSTDRRPIGQTGEGCKKEVAQALQAGSTGQTTEETAPNASGTAACQIDPPSNRRLLNSLGATEIGIEPV